MERRRSCGDGREDPTEAGGDCTPLHPGKGHGNLSIPLCRASAKRIVKGLRKGFPGRRGVLEMQAQ